jgi:transcriptional regulator with XRE-family HTH domain
VPFNLSTAQDVKQDIGVWLRLMRKSRKLSQEELASELGMSRITLQNAENGKNITIDTLLLLLRHFDELEGIHKFIREKKEALANVRSLY